MDFHKKVSMFDPDPTVPPQFPHPFALVTKADHKAMQETIERAIDQVGYVMDREPQDWTLQHIIDGLKEISELLSVTEHYYHG